MTKKCPSCSNQIENDAKFCGFCGAVYEESVVIKDEISDDSISQEQFAQINETKNSIPFPVAIPTKMNFMQLFFSPNGRIGLNTFWVKGILPITVLMIVLGCIGAGIGAVLGNFSSSNQISDSEGILLFCILTPVLIFFLYVMTMVMVKRFHDLDRSGWSMLIQLIPIVGPFYYLWLLKGLYFSKGTPGPNKYGDYSY